MTALDSRQLRSAFGTFVTGVTVVTAVNDDGLPVGFTANSYTSVSLDPPLLLVCPAKTLSSFPVFERCRNFVVNVLAEDQRDIANTFATAAGERFESVLWDADNNGCPAIRGAAATFSCAAHERLVAGDHLILIGQVTRFATTGETGLGYSNSGYFSLGLERRASELPAPDQLAIVGAIIEHQGQILMVDTPEGLRPPQVRATGRTGSIATLRAYLAQAGMAVDFGPVYSIFDNQATGEHATFYRAVAKDSDPRGLGRFVGVDELVSQRFATGALDTMMKRYLLERRNGVFCLYVGDEVKGDVHMFGEGRQS